MIIDFIQIPIPIIQNNTIRDIDKIIYGIILYTSKWELGMCIASNKTISEFLGKSDSTVAHAIIRLKEAGLIQINNPSPRKREIVPCITIQSKIDLIVQKDTQPCTNIQANDCINIQTNNNIYNNNINIIYNILQNINPLINSMRGYSSQRKACESILKQEKIEDVLDILNWYVTEYKRTPRSQFLPLATIPTKFVEKWQPIKELYLSKQKQGDLTENTIDAIMAKYNK